MSKFVPGSRILGTVTHVEFDAGLCLGYCQLCEQGVVDELAEAIQINVENGKVTENSWSDDEIVLALFHEDGNWYRGRVVGKGAKGLSIFFVDYGNTETVSAADIRKLPSLLKHIEPLATKCIFVDLTPARGQWTPEEEQAIKDKALEEEFMVEIVNKSQSGLSVKLHSPSATSVSSIPLRMQHVDVNSSHQCYISYIESANKFWVQLKEKENELNDLMSQIAEHCSSSAEVLSNPQMGAYCLTFYSEDEAPYRSQILTSTSGKCLVQFVDFGNSESKSQSDLMKLPSKFVDFPIQGIRCCYKTTKINPSKLEDKLQEVSDSDGGVRVKFLRKDNDEYVVQIDEIEAMEGSTSLNSSQTGESQHEYPVMSLTAKQTCDVCICYVEHPGRFFVQLLSSSDTVNELMDMADEEFITNKPISRPSIRHSCLAKMSDGSVYRSSIESTGSTVRVTSVDFGFTETVDLQNLREISEKLTSIPAQCVQCTVDLTKMSSDYWSEGEINILQGFENNVPLVSMVTSTRGGVYQLDLYDTRDKDIDRYLNEELLGVKKQGKTVSSYKESARRPLVVRRIQIPQPDIIVGSTELVCVTAVHSQNQFYGQLTKIPVDKFASLQETLMKVYEMGQDVIVDGEEGTFCCAKYTDGSWYRALITAVTGSSAEVMFIDFGDSCTVPLTSLYQIHPSIADTPQLCIMCQFQKQPVNVSLSDLQSLLVDKAVEVKLVTKTDGVYPTFQIEFTSHSNNRNITSKLFGNQHKIPRLPQVAFQSGNVGEKRGMVSIGDMEEVMVTHVVDPEHFHCQLSKTAAQLDALMDSLDKHYCTLGEEDEQLMNVTLGQHCVAKYSADQDWYRAQITGMLNNGMVELRFIDYGNTECSSKENLKRISDELMTLPPQAVYCGLEGVVSPTGYWLPEKVVQFEDLVLDKTFKATFKSRKADEDLFLCALESETGTNINRMYETKTSSLQTNNSNNNNFLQRGQFGDRSSGGSEGRSSFGGRNQSGFGGSAGGNSGFSKPAEDDAWDETPSASSSSFGGGGRGAFGGGSGGSSFGGGGGRFGGSSRGGGGGFGGSSRGGGNGGGFRSEGGDRGGSGCRKCGEDGHFARDCPQGGSGGGGGRSCHKCGQEGHFIRDCPQADKDRGCRKCGEEGHFARDCPKGGGGGRGCHKCGEEGHFARDCTSTNQRSDRGFGGRGGGSSFGGRGGGGSFGDRGGSRESRGGFGGSSGRPSGGFGGGFGGTSTTASAEDDWGDSSSDNKPQMSRSDGGFQGRKPSGGFQSTSGGGGGFGGGKSFSPSKEEDDWGDEPSTAPSTDKSPAKSPGWSATPKKEGGSEWGHTDSNVYRLARLPSDKAVKVYVVYVKSPTEFWCQTISKSEELEEMMEKMNEEYGSLFPKERCIHEYEVGTPCVAKFSDDDRWYRGEISKVEDDKVGVHFVDYGNTETVDKSALKAANANYMSLEVQGVKCSLDGVVREDWSSEAIEKFEELVMDKELQATVVNFSGGLYLLKLTDGEDDVAKSLADAGLCKISSASTVTKLAENPYSKLLQQEGNSVSAFVSWIENPHNFWIQPEEMAEKLEQLVTEIQDHYEAGGSKVDSVNPGDPVVTKFTEDEAWYRAYIENTEGSDVIVRFVDYGNTDTISKDAVYQVADDFRQIPGQSLRCSLTGVKPLQSGWSEDAKEIMQSLIPEAVNVNFIGENPDGTWVVSLSVGEVDVAEELIGAAVARKEVSGTSDSSTSVAALEFPPQTSLPVGSSHQVFVSHFNSPTSFYCQLAQKSDQLDELLGNIEEQAASFTPVNSLMEGMACMAKYSSDEAWYRSEVTRVAENKADILFVDYGNSEPSSMEDICNIPPELLKIEPQAVHCKLSSTAGVGDDLGDQLADKEMTLKVVNHSPTCLTVDLFFDDGKPLTEAGTVTQESSPQEAPMYQYTSYAEPAGTRLTCFATYIQSPDVLYLQKEGCEASLEAMTSDLQQKAGGSSILANPKSGQICGTVFSEDNAWYRGVIEEMTAGKARVRFIDYGNSEEVEANSLKILPSELASIPPFAYPCSLHGVSPLEGDWSSEVKTQLESLIVDKDLTCTFMTGSEVKLEVESKDVGQCLKDANLAKYEESSSVPVVPAKVTSLQEQAVPTEQTTAYVSNSDKDGFYLQLASQEEQLGEIIENVQIHCGTAESLGDVVVNDYCCAKFTTDDSWYRARVRDIRGEMVDVLFIDFGNSDTVSKDNLRCLGNTAPALAYPCCLTGCTVMSSRQLERFSELTTDAEVMVTFDTQTADKHAVTLMIDDQNINKEIIQLGESEAEPTDKSADLPEPTDDSADLPETEEKPEPGSQSVLMDESHITLDKTGYSDLNVTGNEAGDPSEDTISSSTELKVAPSDNEDTISSLNELKVAEVSAGDRVEASVSCVYSPSCFYIHPGSPTPLSDLMDQMYEFYSNALPEAHRLETVEINTPCAAKFTEDSSWYRCVVKKQVDVDKVEVIFLDHGNVEVCDIADLRRLLRRFCELPLQTVECSLAGVMAKDGPWDEEAVILFNNLTLDKTLLVDIVSQGDDNSCMVQLLHLGLSLSDRLIEEGHGVQATTPVAVSRKVKRVFSDSSDVATPSLKLSEECPAVKEDRETPEECPAVKEEDQTPLYGRFKPVPVEIDTEYVVTISHSRISGNFWCHLADNVTSLGEMMDEMLQEFSPSNKQMTSPQNGDNAQMSENGGEELSPQKEENGSEKILGNELEEFEPGTTCCVHFPVDGQYYRSVIQEEGKHSVKVFFVDFGNLETVTKHNVRQLPDKFSEMAAQAVHCRLAGLTSMLWNKSSSEKFDEMTEDKELLMYIVEKMEEEVNIVQLFDGDTSISRCLIGGDSAESDHVTDDDQSIDLISLFSPYSCTLLSLDMEYDITVTAVESPLQFCVRLKDCNEVPKIQEEITKLVEEGLQKLVNIKEGDACLVLSSKENQYQRAKCLKVINEEQIQVLFVDSGEKEIVKIDSVFSIPDSLVQIPAQVSVCALTDIFSSTGTWSKEARLFFSDHIQDVSVMYVRHMTETGLYRVAVEFEGQELNRLMVDLGYAGAEANTTLSEQMMEVSNVQETSFNELALERENSFGSEGEGDDQNVAKSLNLDSTLETTDASICMCHDSTLDTTSASDSFHYINVKKDEDVKDEFFDAVDEDSKQQTVDEPRERTPAESPQRPDTEDGSQSEAEHQREPVKNETDEEKVDEPERTEEEEQPPAGAEEEEQPPAGAEENKGEIIEEAECEDKTDQKEEEVVVDEDSKGNEENLDKSEEVGDGKTEKVDDDKTEEVDDDKTEKVGDGKTEKVGDDKTEEVGDDKTKEVDDGKTEEVGDDKTKEVGDGKTEKVGDDKTKEVGDEEIDDDKIEDVDDGEKTGTVMKAESEIKEIESSRDNSIEDRGPENSSDVKCEEDLRPDNSSDVKCEDSGPDNSSNVKCEEDSRSNNSSDVKHGDDPGLDNSSNVRYREDKEMDNSSDVKCEEDTGLDNSSDVKCEEDQSGLDVRGDGHSGEGDESGKIVETDPDTPESSEKDSEQDSSVKQDEKEDGVSAKDDKHLETSVERDVGDEKGSNVSREENCTENCSNSNVEKGNDE